MNFDGVVFIKSTLFFLHNSFNNIGLFCSWLSANTTFNPLQTGNKLSTTNISKLIVVIDTTVFPFIGVILFIEYIKLTTLLCLIITPFGFPVEPDV